MVEVIGAGLPRTGTSSMKAALEQLGFAPTYHMFELMTHPDHLDRWLSALGSGPVDWDRVTQGYRAGVDWPFSYFWRELADAYPQAKVVLSDRDAHKWHASMANTIYRTVISLRDGGAAAEGRDERFGELMRPLWDSLFDQAHRIPKEAESVEVFERHRAAVIEALPAERLLVHRPADGWEPLCDFLGAAVPDTPYPHLNDGEAMQQIMADIRAGRQVTSPFG